MGGGLDHGAPPLPGPGLVTPLVSVGVTSDSHRLPFKGPAALDKEGKKEKSLRATLLELLIIASRWRTLLRENKLADFMNWSENTNSPSRLCMGVCACICIKSNATYITEGKPVYDTHSIGNKTVRL